jgi:hypothetical protein
VKGKGKGTVRYLKAVEFIVSLKKLAHELKEQRLKKEKEEEEN